jgi:hypothetical protein
MWYNRVNLKFQWEWTGAQLQNLYILVCNDCYDIPQQQLRAITLPADPVPIYFPSVEDFAADETDYRVTSGQTTTDPITGLPVPGSVFRVTPEGTNRTLEPFGKPVGLEQPAIMPYDGAVQMAFGQPLALLSVTSNGTATVTVTCSQPHGLVTNSQISVEGLSNSAACGFYSVTVTTATAFTYMTYGLIPGASLLTPTSRIVTALVGLPRGYATIPQIDGGRLHTPAAPTVTDSVELESGDGAIELESGDGTVELESG